MPIAIQSHLVFQKFYLKNEWLIDNKGKSTNNRCNEGRKRYSSLVVKDEWKLTNQQQGIEKKILVALSSCDVPSLKLHFLRWVVTIGSHHATARVA